MWPWLLCSLARRASSCIASVRGSHCLHAPVADSYRLVAYGVPIWWRQVSWKSFNWAQWVLASRRSRFAAALGLVLCS